LYSDQITRIPAPLFLGLIITLISCASGAQNGTPVVVNVDNFVRAETAVQFDRVLQLTGGINEWVHFRQPTPLNRQPVIRMNRDTLYSSAIVDISNGASLTIPDTEGRYMSVMVVNEDHYVNRVFHDPGTYEITMGEFDTAYVQVTARTLVDVSDPKDILSVNALQDQLKIVAGSTRRYRHPNYDEESYEAIYELLLALGRSVPDLRRSFGRKEDVSEVRHLLAAAFGWGGLPDDEAQYLNVEPNLPVGAYSVTVKGVPVDAFWSISVYNEDGYFQENEYNVYSVNNIAGTPNSDGSFTVHLGGDPQSVNYIPITEGWNYVVRMYQPRDEILDGSWRFPGVKPSR